MYLCMYICMYVDVCVCKYVCMQVCMYSSMWVCLSVCLSVCMYLCMYVCMCMGALVFLSCEITSKTKMIVITEVWVLCEIDITMFLQISFLFLV